MNLQNMHFKLDLTVEAHHLDGLGHVNNVIYLQWMQNAAWAHSHYLGLNLERYQALDTAMVARQHQLTYLSACYLGDELRVNTWLTKNDGFNLYRQYEFIRLQDNKKVFEAWTHWVCVKMSTGRPVRMPVEFKKAYAIA